MFDDNDAVEPEEVEEEETPVTVTPRTREAVEATVTLVRLLGATPRPRTEAAANPFADIGPHEDFGAVTEDLVMHPVEADALADAIEAAWERGKLSKINGVLKAVSKAVPALKSLFGI